MIEQKLLERTEKRRLKKVMAIVIHWPGPQFIPTIDGLWNWMNKGSENSYHYFISGNRIMNIRSKDLRAIHCGHRTYRKRAKDFFGESICSDVNSPNNYTLGVCMIHDRSDGGYSTETMESAIELLSGLCNEYGLDPRTDLLRHSDITNEKEVSCPKGFFEDDEDPDDLWRSFKQWIYEDMQFNFKGSEVV